MSAPTMRKAVEDRWYVLIEQHVFDSFQHGCVEDCLADLECLANAKTFKEICEIGQRDYREEIRLLRKELEGVSDE